MQEEDKKYYFLIMNKIIKENEHFTEYHTAQASMPERDREDIWQDGRDIQYHTDLSVSKFLIDRVLSGTKRRFRVIIETTPATKIPLDNSQKWRVVFTDGYQVGTDISNSYGVAVLKAFLDLFCVNYYDEVHRLKQQEAGKNGAD